MPRQITTWDNKVIHKNKNQISVASYKATEI